MTAQNTHANYGQRVYFQVANAHPYDDPTTTIRPPRRTPAMMPTAYMDNHILYFDGSHPAFTLTLLSGDTVVYQTCVDATDGSVTLPSDLSGDYELQLSSSDDFYYYAEITLS